MEDNSKQRKIGVILSYISIIASSLVQLLYTPILISSLGQSEYGLYSLIASVIGYLTVLDLGFGNAIIVYTSKYRAKNEKDKEEKLLGMFKVVFSIIAVIATIIGIILFFNVDNLWGNTMSPEELGKAKIMMLILTFNLAITFKFNIFQSILTAYEKFIFIKIMSIVNTLLKPMLMLPLLFLGAKSVTLVVVITIVNMVVLFSNYYFCKKKLHITLKFKGFDSAIFKTILAYSIYIFLSVITDKVNWSLDEFILGTKSGTVEVAIYAAAAVLNQLFISLSVAVCGVFLPKISAMIANGVDSNGLTNEFIRVGRVQFYIIFLMCSGLVILGKNFMNIWIGEEFAKSYYVAIILIIPLAISLIQNLGLSIIQAMNKFKFKAIASSITAIFNVIISILLVDKYGAIGCAIGTAISLIVVNIIVMNIYYYKAIKIDVIKFWIEIFKIAIPLVVPIVLIIIIMQITALSGIKAFILYGIIYVTMYSIISYFCCMNQYEKGYVHILLSKIIKKKEKNEIRET